MRILAWRPDSADAAFILYTKTVGGFCLVFRFFSPVFSPLFCFHCWLQFPPVLPPVTLICGADWWAAQAAGDVLLGLLFFLLFLLAGLKGRINWLIMKWGAYGKCKVIEFG